MSLQPSHARQQEDDREYRVEYDDAEDRFDHRARRQRPDALRAAAHLQTLETADGGDDEAEHRRFDHAGIEMPGADRVAQAVEELHEGEIEIERTGDRASEKPCHVTPEGQQRHRDHQGDDPRHHQPFDRVETDRAHRVDFLVHLHGADLRGEGAARAAGDDDRRQQHAELAEHADADSFDGKGFGAELAELLHTLVGDHHADQEAEHANDGQRLDPDLVHLAHDGVEAKAPGMEAGFEEDHDDLTEELAHVDDLAAEMDETLADVVQPMDQPVDVLGRGRLLGEVHWTTLNRSAWFLS